MASPEDLTKAFGFGEANYTVKAVKKNRRRSASKWEVNMGWLVPAAMVAMVVIAAVTLTRL